MSGQSVSQNMKKPSRRLLPMASSQPMLASRTPTASHTLGGPALACPSSSRAHEASHRSGCLLKLRRRLVATAPDCIRNAVGHVVVEELQGNGLQCPGRGGYLL